MNEIRLDKSAIRFGKGLVLLNGAVPAILLAWDAYNHRLGANPTNFAIRTTGFLALIFLLLSLVVTPAAKVSGQNWLGHFRRSLGLYAFFHTCAHFTLFFWFDRGANVSSTLSEMWLRKYLLVGATGLILMAPLAVTSTNAAIRRLGPKRWKALHRLAYLAAIAGVAHYYMLQKADVQWPIVYAGVLGILLSYRLIGHYYNLRLAASALKHAPASPVHARPKFWKGQLRVIHVFDETSDVRTFRLATLDGTSLPFDYRPGQYMNLALMVDGQAVNRSYTIASSPTRTGFCELTIKREPMGVSSRHLHGMVKVGQTLAVSAPAGKFIFDGRDAESIVMIAGGVGITPLMSKIRYLTERAWPGDIFLIFSVRTDADIIFREELAYLSHRYANLHVTITLTRAGDGWAGEKGRVTPDLVSRIVPNITQRRVHVCGPTEMADATQAMLLAMGVPANQIAMESFTSPLATQNKPADPRVDHAALPAATSQSPGIDPALPDTGTRYAVTFTRSGKTIDAPVGQTILEIAEAENIPLDFDCRSGICGQCKTKLLDGEVTMDADDALTQSDRTSNIILACQAHCASDITVDA